VTKHFPHLLAPGKIGAMSLRNRLVMSPMETMYGTPDGLPSERTRDYFAARAKGGVGLMQPTDAPWQVASPLYTGITMSRT
jgi:2,4-dienoyl-CoA reductase (NADPH2)